MIGDLASNLETVGFIVRDGQCHVGTVHVEKDAATERADERSKEDCIAWDKKHGRLQS